MTATYIIDSAPSQIFDDGSSATYYFDETDRINMFTIGSYTYTTASSTLRILNDFLGALDGYSFANQDSVVITDDFPIGINVAYVDLLATSNLSLLTTNFLPAMEIPVEDFDVSQFYIGGFAGSPAIKGTITSYALTQIPEPGSIALVGGLVVLAACIVTRRGPRAHIYNTEGA